MAEKTTVTVHQTRYQRGIRRRTGNVTANNTGTVINVDRFVAVFSHDVAQAVGEQIQRLIPADAFELAFAAFADALHGII